MEDRKVRIALLGYGRMGRLVGTLAPDYGCHVVAIIDSGADATNSVLSQDTLADAEVCIDFTQPSAVLTNVHAVSALGRAMVVGTTGWQQQLDEAQRIVKKAGTGLVHGANFSIGMNAFYAIVDAAAEIMAGMPGYDTFGLELHHRGKADSPSGTARTLSQIVLKRMNGKKKVLFDTINRPIEAEELHFTSVRAGAIPGTHLIGFDSPADTIELKHTARSREGFAVGALLAARWIAGKRGVFDFRDIFFELLRQP